MVQLRNILPKIYITKNVSTVLMRTPVLSIEIWNSLLLFYFYLF